MKPDKAISDLTKLRHLYCENGSRSYKAMTAGIEALEKAEPKMVTYYGNDVAECPTCRRYYDDGDRSWKASYCDECGQALKWEEGG